MYGLILVILAAALCDAYARTAVEKCANQPAFRQLIQQGDDGRLAYGERKAAYERALVLCSGPDDAYHSFALLLLQHREFEEAQQWIHRGLKLTPDNPQLKMDASVVFLSEGQPEEALTILKSLPLSAQGQFYLGMAYRALRDHKLAQQAFSQALSLGYQDPYVLYVLIEQDRALRDKDQGLKDFQTLDQRFPDSPWLHMVVGDAFLSRYEDTNAKSEYQRALELNPQLPIAHYQLGFIAFNRADYTLAAGEFRKEIGLDPGFGESFLYLGMSLRRLGKNQEALPLLKKAVALDPNSVLAYSALAAAEREANQIDAALETLRAGEKRFPNDPSFPAQLAALLRQAGRSEQAEGEAALAQSLSRKSNRPHPAPESAPRAGPASSGDGAITAAAPERMVEKVQPANDASVIQPAGTGSEVSASLSGQSPKSPMADLRLCLERHNAACATAALAAIRDPAMQQGADYDHLKAQTLALEREEEEALAANQTTVDANPAQPKYLITRGHIYEKFGDHVAAIECFLKAANLEPHSPEPLYFIGTSFFLLAERLHSPEFYARAEANLKAALKLAPDYDRAEFMLGVIEAMQARLSEAQTHLQQAVRMKPANPYYHLHYGILLKRLGDDAGAMKEMRTAEGLYPSYALTHYELGSLYEKLGDYPQARTQLESAVDLNPQLSAAYYHLRGVYHHLGLLEQSQRAYDKFKLTQSPEGDEVADPAVTAVSIPDIETVQH